MKKSICALLMSAAATTAMSVMAQPSASAGSLPVIKWTLKRGTSVVGEGSFLATPDHTTEIHPEGKAQEFIYTSACKVMPGGATKATKKTAKLGVVIAVKTGPVGATGADVSMGLSERKLIGNREVTQNGCTVDLPTIHEEQISRQDSLAAGMASTPVPLGEYAVILAYVAPSQAQ